VVQSRLKWPANFSLSTGNDKLKLIGHQTEPLPGFTTMNSRLLLSLACSVLFAVNNLPIDGFHRTVRLDGPAVAQEIEFKAVHLSSGRKANGAEFSAGLYDSSDGVGVLSTVETYGSPARAKAEMKKRIRGAIKVIDRSDKIDQSGKAISERVVLRFSHGSRRKSYSAVMWTNDEDLYVIESTSLRHALAFEQRFYN
jgi:hypothetical protein